MPLPARISALSTGLLRAFSIGLFLALIGPAFGQGSDPALYKTGEKVFKGNCASCHKPIEKMTGPALKGAKARWEGKGDIHAWVKNSQDLVKAGNPYAVQLFNEYKKSVMTPNAISDAEIDAVLYYADNYVPPVTSTPTPVPGTPVEEPSTAWQWLLILVLLFAIVWASLRGVKNQLRSAVSELEGQGPVAAQGPLRSIVAWAGRNKAWASIIGLFITSIFTVMLWNWAFRIGVYGGDTVEHYKPTQPIAFNHTLHAGKADKGNLQINCIYCHNSAEKSKHAGIPSTNVCMNCHKAVSTGKKTGTAEIQKIYDAIGWDPTTQTYSGEQHPLKWVKVHNLPDHVSFNHATHVSIGKIECQKCHGPIDSEMDVAEQWAPLTMGWCIDCHAQTEVQMAGNGYYDEIHRRLKESPMGQRELQQYLEDEKITVKELGGWECAKCHY